MVPALAIQLYFEKDGELTPDTSLLVHKCHIMKLHSTLACKIIQLQTSKDTHILLQEIEMITEDLTADSLNSKAIFSITALAHISLGSY